MESEGGPTKFSWCRTEPRAAAFQCVLDWTRSDRKWRAPCRSAQLTWKSMDYSETCSNIILWSHLFGVQVWPKLAENWECYQSFKSGALCVTSCTSLWLHYLNSVVARQYSKGDIFRRVRQSNIFCQLKEKYICRTWKTYSFPKVTQKIVKCITNTV